MATRQNIPATLRDFGANVRRIRVRNNMTQESLAEAVDLNIRTVQKIEAGQTNILITTLLRIQQALNCSFEELFRREA